MINFVFVFIDLNPLFCLPPREYYEDLSMLLQRILCAVLSQIFRHFRFSRSSTRIAGFSLKSIAIAREAPT